MYTHTNRVLLYTFGVVSFLSLSTGMWLFALSSPPFYWYGVFAGAMCLYLGASYAVGIFGRDWDEAPHAATLEMFAETVQDADAAPSMDVLLPCCHEPLEVLANTYEHVAKLEWPANKLRVHVLDDGDDGDVAALAARWGFGLSLIHI